MNEHFKLAAIKIISSQTNCIEKKTVSIKLKVPWSHLGE